jgi:hypothetical protein
LQGELRHEAVPVDMVYKNAKEGNTAKKIKPKVTLRGLFCLSILVGRYGLFHKLDDQQPRLATP